MFDDVYPPRWTTETGWAITVSLVLHLLLAVAVLYWRSNVPPVRIEGIPVDFLTQEEFAAATGTEPAQEARLEQPPAQTEEPPPAMIHAATLLSARALAEPRNRSAREGLPRLAPTERMVQLCNLEALEQVAAMRKDIWPEWVTAYAEKELTVSAHTITADGAAFRVGDDWYRLKYRCELSPDNTTVVAFDFLAGDQISAARIEALGLAVGK